MLGPTTRQREGAARDHRRWRYLLPVALALLAPRLAAIDGDTNGVSDVWASFYGATNMAPGDDADGDSQDSLMESVAGTDPWDRSSRFECLAQGGPPESEGSQTNIVVSWFAVQGKRYEVWASRDLLDWEFFDGPFLGSNATLSISDTLSGSEGEDMMALQQPSEEQQLIESLDPRPSWWPHSATTDSTDKAAVYNFQFVCVSVFAEGLCSMTLFDGEEQYRILSNLPIGSLPGFKIWQDRPSGWGAFFLDHWDSWDSYVRFYEIADADKYVAALLESKTAAYTWEPFPKSYYSEPKGWVLEFFEWMHAYYDANRGYFDGMLAAVEKGTYDEFLMETAPALATLEGEGVMNAEGTTDETRRFYRVQTIQSVDWEGDGLDAYEEGLLGTSDASADSDGDGVDDAIEFSNGLCPTNNVDSDADGMPDDWESNHFGSLARSTAPTVAWMSPTNGAAIAVGTEVYLAASVTDHDLVTNVVFFADGTNVGEDASYPYAVPWSNSVPGPHSLWATATFGQGATTGSAPVSVTIFDPDPDGDGSPDAWELQWFGSTTNPAALASADPDGDGMTNGFERLEGTSPLDYFNGDLPEMEIVGGDMQGAPTNAFLAEALAVRLTRPSGLVYSNAPVTFSAPAGGLSETSGGQTFLSLDVRADANGIARAWYRTPSAASTNAITATASNATDGVSVPLTAFAGAGKPTLSVLAPDNLASEPGINRGLFHVVRAGNPWVSVTAQLGLSGTASNGLDYDSLPTNLLLSAGLLTGAIEVVVRDDTNSEAPETVVLRLLTNSAYDVGSPASNSVTVADNDSGGGTAAIGAGEGFSAAIMYDGTIWTWGSDANGRLGNGDESGSTNQPAQLQGLAGFREISCGTAHVLALASNGTIKAWGNGGSGRLGNNDDGDRQDPDDVDNLTGAIAVSAGDDHSMALTNGGKVFCWGDNQEGQVGVGTTTDSYDQPQLTTLTSGVTRLGAGRRNSYAVQTGSLKGCGNNGRGQLARPTSGVGNIGSTNRFINVLGTADDVASGREFVLARVGDKIWTWGENQDWQLGAESPTYRTNAAQVAGISNVIAVAAGRNHSMALRSDGSVWCWGLGDNGRLGDENGEPHKSATPYRATAPGFSNIIAIAAGKNHSMALDKQGWIWVWGANGNGQLGLGDNDDRDTPTRIETLNLLSYPPSVQITAPANGLSLTNAAGHLALAATAEDPDGSVARVDFYEGTNLIGSDTSAPFTATWTNLTVGTWTVTAKATDDKGVTATSVPVTVTIASDGDSLDDAWEHLWFGNLDAEPGGDADGDGLTNAEEQQLGTKPIKVDSDGDLLLDKFEDAGGLDPLTPNNINDDLDGDGLNLLQEQIAGTNPSLADTDGDGTPDGIEFNQGSNPNYADDGGQPPPENETVTIRVRIGDHSGSQSERYYMVIRDTQPGGQVFFPQAEQFGVVETKELKFRAGRAYEVEIRHVDTNLEEGGPDYDYTAEFEPMPGDAQRFITDDPEGILGVHDESEEFFPEGKSATLLTVRLESIDVTGQSNPCQIVQINGVPAIQLSAQAELVALVEVPDSHADRFNVRLYQNIRAHRTGTFAIPPPTTWTFSTGNQMAFDGESGFVSRIGGTIRVFNVDIPAHPLPEELFAALSVNDSLSTFVQYQYSGGTWVTLGRVDWTFVGACTKGTNGWTGSAFTSTASGGTTTTSPNPPPPTFPEDFDPYEN